MAANKYEIRFVLSDGTVKTVEFEAPEGPAGKGISGVTLNSDYTLTISFSDGTSITTESIRGLPGKDGVGIESVVQTTTSDEDSGENVVTIKLTDGTTKTVTFKNGTQGNPGPRGTGNLKITTAPTSYSTTVGGFTPTYRIALSTVTSQSKVKEVLVGDVILYSFYQYPVGYVDSSYVYTGARTSIRGAKGDAGVTPVKGTDYWTEEDQEDIVQQVIAALGTPVFGTIDENKHITLSGHLVDGTYTLSFEDTDGFTTEVCSINKTSGPSYTNQIPISVDTDGTIFNGTGYMAAKRINSSHAVVDLQNTDATNPAFVTGLIPVKAGDVFRFKNCYFDTVNTDKSAKYGFANWNGRICYYDSGKQWVNENVWTSFYDGDDTYATAVVGSDGLCYEMTFKNNISTSGYKYVRFNLAGTPETAIITINEPIE